jgi:predicted DNA binding CopG/RHH family protein
MTTTIQSSPKTTVITLRITTDLLETLRSQANKEEIPMSYIIRRALKKHLNTEVKPVPKSTETTLPEDWE